MLGRLLRRVFVNLGYLGGVRYRWELNASERRLRFFHTLRRLGMELTSVVDVGANRGEWARDVIRVFPDCRIALIDANGTLRKHSEDLLKRDSIEWFTAGVSDDPGELPFVIRQDDTSSSFQFSSDSVQATDRQVTVEVLTLTDFCRTNGIDRPSLIKIDAEGYDLRALAGAGELLDTTPIVCVEACFAARSYDNSAETVIRTMADRGYFLLDMLDMNRTKQTDVLWVGELVFVRNHLPWMQSVTYLK